MTFHHPLDQIIFIAVTHFIHSLLFNYSISIYILLTLRLFIDLGKKILVYRAIGECFVVNTIEFFLYTIYDSRAILS